MSGTAAPRLWRASTTTTIEADLFALWSDAGRAGPIARALMSNLVVYRPGVAAPDVIEPDVAVSALVDEVARRHPSRVLLVWHAPTPGRCETHAGVGILVAGSGDARLGIEQIVVHSTGENASLPSIVRRLTLGDMPTTVWWNGDFSEVKSPRPLLGLCRQLVYDSREWSSVEANIAAIGRIAGDLDLADLNWRRLDPLRRVMAQACGPDRPAAFRFERALVRHRPGDAALAWLAAGWMMSSVGWSPDHAPVTVEEAPASTALAIEAGADRLELTATLDASQARASFAGESAIWSATVPRETQADAIVAELRTLHADSALDAALRSLGVLFASRERA